MAMNVEPLSSVMGMQVQTTTPAKQVAPAQKAPEQYEHAESVDPAAKLDGATAVVESAQEKGDSNYREESGERQTTATNDQIRKAVEQINKANMEQSEAIFGIHEGTNRVTIKIVDKETKKVIKELPPEKTLDMIAKAWELAGILVDEKR